MLLFVALSVIALLLWQAWQQDYGPKPPPRTTAEQPAGQPAAAGGGDVPSAEVPSGAPPSRAASRGEDVPGAGASAPTMSGATVRVVTDVLDLEIATLGGDIVAARLLQYPISLEPPLEPFPLLKTGDEVFIAQSGLLGDGVAAPDHHASFSAEATEYRLAAGGDELSVPLTWTGPDGTVVEKVYTLRRDSYVIEVEHRVRNNGAAEWKGRQYRQLQRSRPTDQSYWTGYSYTGAVYYSPETKYEKSDFDDIAQTPLSANYANGWVAMIQHYFLAAWIPNPDQVNHFYTKALSGGRYLIGMVSPDLSIAPGASEVLRTRLYVGPKLQSRLPEVAPNLELTVDFGLLTVISQPLFWLLEWIHKLVGNWGWAIVILTLLIKLAFYKLSETSYRSMANMRKMQPRIQALRDRYGDDKQRLNQAMMEIYKKEKINPLGGCLPILVQIPVFIALYWVLLESVELRQAPFMLWLNDLSVKDPYYVLPILMGASMFFQQRLNPAPPDPVQAKVMMMLPFVFTVMFLWFPAGLVLYWLVNNIISIAQQWYITHRIEKMAH